MPRAIIFALAIQKTFETPVFVSHIPPWPPNHGLAPSFGLGPNLSIASDGWEWGGESSKLTSTSNATPSYRRHTWDPSYQRHLPQAPFSKKSAGNRAFLKADPNPPPRGGGRSSPARGWEPAFFFQLQDPPSPHQTLSKPGARPRRGILSVSEGRQVRAGGGGIMAFPGAGVL